MHKKYGRKENIRKQNVVIKDERKRRVMAYYSIAAFIIINCVFLFFFTWTFFEKDIHINLIPIVLTVINTVLIKKVFNEFYPFAKSFVVISLSIILFLLLLTIYKDKLKEHELRFYGKRINVLISEKKWNASAKGLDYWIVLANFNVGNKIYSTFFTKDEDGTFEVGDTTQLIYSTRNPEISKFVELEE
ncbi:hypothetical protein [uncultured Cytophaga sp.]|uniref:hypothetical protein n=1 Tax=uncultured Cytophaga sp. TaxID=160238 RepID=UPI00261FE9C5|nr:hypothetical protein [uncultured Cytophaga sp.]